MFLLELWKVVAIHLPPFLLDLEQVGLLSLVIHLPGSLSFLQFFELVLQLFRLLLETIDSSYQILIDVLLDDLILYLCYLLQSLDLPQVLIDLSIDS